MRHHTRKTHIPLRTRVRTLAIALHHGEQRAAGVLLALTVVLAMLYVYFLGSAVVHAVARREVQQDIARTSSHVADLEGRYLQAKNRITEDMAHRMGFRSVAQKEYVERARFLGRADTRTRE